MTTAARDAVTICIRESLPGWRSPFTQIFGMIQPLVFLALFGPLLTEIPGIGAQGSWQWFVPGILIMLALFGTTGTGYMLLTEIQTGSHERLLVTPMNRSAILVGKSLKDVSELMVQAIVIVVVMTPFGFRLYPLGALLGLALVGLVGVGLGTLSYALALALRKNQEAFYGVQQTLLFPLLFLSGLMLPLDMGPGWMQTIGNLNPLSYIVEATRTLFAGHITEPEVLQGLVAALVLAVLGVSLSTRGMRRAE
jgi:ABC-2 type transport system permease protein